MTVDELLERAAACKTCGKPHKHRRIAPNQGSWAAEDGHEYRHEIDLSTIAKLRYMATGKYEDPWALPPAGPLGRVLARAFD